MKSFPNSNAACDFPAPNSLPQTLRENHEDQFTLAFCYGRRRGLVLNYGVGNRQSTDRSGTCAPW
jgi:hypothetical protein